MPFLGRKKWFFARSDEGGRRAAAIYTLIATAKLNDVDPQTWLADVLSPGQAHSRDAALELASAEHHRSSGLIKGAFDPQDRPTRWSSPDAHG
jgi:hypothetical protein